MTRICLQNPTQSSWLQGDFALPSSADRPEKRTLLRIIEGSGPNPAPSDPSAPRWKRQPPPPQWNVLDSTRQSTHFSAGPPEPPSPVIARSAPAAVGLRI